MVNDKKYPNIIKNYLKDIEKIKLNIYNLYPNNKEFGNHQNLFNNLINELPDNRNIYNNYDDNDSILIKPSIDKKMNIMYNIAKTKHEIKNIYSVIKKKIKKSI